MNGYTLVVDNRAERRASLVRILDSLSRQGFSIPPVKICTTPDQVIRFSAFHSCPIIFTGVDLPGMNGFTMIERVREVNRRTNFILLADNREYVVQALLLKLRLSGSITGQPDPDSVSDQLNNLWYPLSESE